MMTHVLAAQSAQIAVPGVEYSVAWPAVIPFVGALAILLQLAVTKRPIAARNYTMFTVALFGTSIGSVVYLWDQFWTRGPFDAFSRSIVVDGFGLFVATLILVGAIGVQLIALPYLQRQQLPVAEFSILQLCATTGALLMVMSNDLIVLFLGVEILSIALYVLAAFNRRRRVSGEAAIKYFILGSFASAVLLYGIALTYGATGNTNISQIRDFLAVNQQAALDNGLMLAGMGLLLVGLCFKVAAVPFHMWTPDVYQGSPTPVTAYMAGVAKAAGFAALIRVFFSAFPALIDAWRPLFYVSAVLTLLVGSVLAIVQRDVKRMLAYSSISHAGFMLLGVQSGTIQGREGVLVYLLSYLFVVLGSFTIVSMVGGQRDSAHSLADYQGLARHRPVLAACFTLFLLAQAGVPGTSGFIAKFGVILASTDAEAYPLAVIAMLSAAIAAFFYLRLALVMYGGSSSITPTTSQDDGVIPLDELADGEVRREGKSRLVIGLPQAIVLAASVTVTIAVGVFPALAFNLAQSATLMLR